MNRIVFLCIAMLLPLSKLTGRALFTADSYYPRFKRHNLKDTERGRPKKTKPVKIFFGNSQVFHIKEENKRFKKELKKIQDDYELLHKTREKQQVFLQKKEDKAAILQGEVEQLKIEIKSLNVEHQSCKKDVGRLKDFDRVRDENKELITQNKKLTQEAKELSKDRSKQEKDIQNVRMQLEKKGAQATQFEDEVEQLQGEVKSVAGKLKLLSKEEVQLRKKAEQSAVLENEIEQLQGEIKSLNVEYQVCKKDTGRLKDNSKVMAGDQLLVK